MKLEISDNFIIKDCFNTIGLIVDTIILECDSEGIRLHALDRSHITFVGLELKSSLFDEYVCSEPETITVDAEELMKVLKRCKPSDLMKIESHDEKLTLVFEGDSSRTFKLSLIDSDYEKDNPPSINPPVTIQLPVGLLEDFLKDMELFSDKIIFTVDEDYLICTGNNELGDSTVKYLHGEQVKEVVQSMFNIDKIKDMMKAKKLANTVSLGLGEDMPLILKFNISNGEGELSFLLAPRLAEEE